MGDRVPATNAERQRRYKARKRAEDARVTKGMTLTPAAEAADREAMAELGADYARFSSAVRRYVLAVDVAEYARITWEGEGRPMRDTFANGMAGVHPLLKAFEQAAAQAARFGAELGLSPASAKRVNPTRRPGRPVGATSAPDRRPGEPPVLRLAEGPGPLLNTAAANRVNRARGNGGED